MIKTKSHRGLKAVLLGASLLASAYIGDRYNVLDTYVYPVIYRNVESAEGFTDEPFEIQKYVVINDDGKLETYLSNPKEMEYRRIMENNHTARGVDNVLDDIEQSYHNIVDTVKDFFGHQYE